MEIWEAKRLEFDPWERNTQTSEFSTGRKFVRFPVNVALIERFSHDLEIKTREQRNENNKRREIERFDWFIARIQTHVSFGWLSERSGEKTSCPRTF